MLIDTHAHLDVEQFDSDQAAMLGRAWDADVEAIICPAITAASCHAILKLAESDPRIHAALGIQPNSCSEAGPGDWDEVAGLIDHPRVVALGETGLDRYWDFTPMEMQKDYFDRHLRLAQDRDLPVIVHCREAEEDLFPMLDAALARGPLRAVVHSFSGDEAMVAKCVERGLFMSFAGAVTYTNKKFRPLHAAVARVPDEWLLIETDSPYLTPTPLRGKVKRNEPAHLHHTAARLAELRQTSFEQLAALTTANAKRLFRLA